MSFNILVRFEKPRGIGDCDDSVMCEGDDLGSIIHIPDDTPQEVVDEIINSNEEIGKVNIIPSGIDTGKFITEWS